MDFDIECEKEADVRRSPDVRLKELAHWHTL